VTPDIPPPDWPSDLSARKVAEILRPYIDPTADEMVREIRAQIPEFARPANDTYDRTVRLSVEQALNRFLDLLDGRDDITDGWRDMYRAIGAGEMREGRSLESLHAAMRLGARVAWRRLIDFAELTGLPTRVLGKLAEATFQHLDDIAVAAAEGYAQAQSAVAAELDRRRRRLLELMLADPPAAPEAIAAAAALARWREPSQLAVVVLDEQSVAEHPPPMFPPEVLVNLERREPALIVPGPDGGPIARASIQSLGHRRAAVGPAVAPRDVLTSLRWARQALLLAQRGLLHSGPMVWCHEHLGTLVLFRDEHLLTELARRRLAPLDHVRASQRSALAETLLAWLKLDRNANDVAATLHVHPQTVRYRLRTLQQLFGDQLGDPESRFELEIALRARALLAAPR
jgi:hypothetical protein